MPAATFPQLARSALMTGLIGIASVAAAQGPLPVDSRLALARAAADRAGLQQVGLDFRDLYGVIHAESSWRARDGMGRNGVVSRGVAQFEPATARAVGLRNPDDPVESVHAAARLLKEAAAWSAQRIEKLNLSPSQRAARLREGVSIYYNLSTRARSGWNGVNTHRLPVETLRHIQNVRAGSEQADQLHARAGGTRLGPLPTAPALLAQAPATPSAAPPARPRPLGTIEWAGKPGETGPRSFVVLSDGTLQAQRPGLEAARGAVRWTRRT